MARKRSEMRHCKLNGIEYLVEIMGRGQISGLCSSPDAKSPRIYIIESLETKRGLAALLHELLHGEDWSKNEGKVDRIANDLTEALWKFGYRRVKR